MIIKSNWARVMTKAERKILEDALNDIKNKELKRVSVQYEREAYTENWLIPSSTLDKLK